MATKNSVRIGIQAVTAVIAAACFTALVFSRMFNKHRCTTFYTDSTVYSSLQSIPRHSSSVEGIFTLTERDSSENEVVYHLENKKITSYRVDVTKRQENCKEWREDSLDRVLYTEFTCIRDGETTKIMPGYEYVDTAMKTQTDVFLRRINIEQGVPEVSGSVSAGASTSSGILYSSADAHANVNLKTAQIVSYTEQGSPQLVYTSATNLHLLKGEKLWFNAQSGAVYDYRVLPLVKQGGVMVRTRTPSVYADPYSLNYTSSVDTLENRFEGVGMIGHFVSVAPPRTIARE